MSKGRDMATYELPELPYDYSALEPHCSAELLELHHAKHHAAYVKKANELIDMLADGEDLPIGFERALAFNVAGHHLHSLFWTCMSPDGGSAPEGELAAAIKDGFGSVERLKEHVDRVVETTMGSGWAAVAWDSLGQRLHVLGVHDHQGDQLLGATPIFVVDGWEHAYYLDHRNDKEAWLRAFWQMADWEAASDRFAAASRASPDAS
jgi:Fe-Mn family superoxide dismutase